MFFRIRTLKWFCCSVLLIMSGSLVLYLLVQLEKIRATGDSLYPRIVFPVETCHFYQRGNYMVLADFIPGDQPVTQAFNITYVTQSTKDYLDNLRTLVEFWKGFVSVAIYAPGPEFDEAMLIVAKLRKCHGSISEEIRKRVSFHVFYDLNHLPLVDNPGGLLNYNLPYGFECNKKILDVESEVNSKVKKKKSYRRKHQLLYPINMARNIARESSRTHFVLVSDIELFPGPPTLIPEFLALIREMSLKDRRFDSRRQVWVLPPFELKPKVNKGQIPRNKNQLVALLRNNQSFPFHHIACPSCHRIPNASQWMNSNSEPGKPVGIFGTTLYFGTKAWEPFYIGTHAEPPFDERIFREFSLNKNVQVSAMCHLDYKFHILDNAFLVHKPGIREGRGFWNYSGKRKVYEFIKSTVLPLQEDLYGYNKRCRF